MNPSPLVVMVCTLNCCRSPLAEGLLRKQWRRQPDIQVSSAGISAVPGFPASPQAVQAAAELGVDIRGHRSCAIDQHFMLAARMVIAMTRQHAYALQRAFPQHSGKVVTLGELARGDATLDVPDPVGSDLGTYREIAVMIQGLLAEAEPEILRRLESRKNEEEVR